MKPTFLMFVLDVIIVVQLVFQVHFQKSIVGLSLSLNKNVQ
jgi:hypothetical protein